MKKMFLAALAMAALLTSCGEDKGVQLFNGKDLTGWVAYSDPSSDVTPDQLFTVQDGVIHALGMPYGYLRTAKKYADYVAYAEFRWADGQGTNSGFFQRVQEGDAIWPGMIEVQLKVGTVGDTGGTIQRDPSQTGPFKPRLVNDEGLEKPAGEWNQLEVSCIGSHVTVKLNGVLVNEAETTLTEGFIALQSEGGPIEFRNVYVKELKPATGADVTSLLFKPTPLFNGESLRGWVPYVDPSTGVKPEEVFTVKDGVINVSGQPFGYMRTRNQYRDYKLHAEWRWVGEPSNSGLFQRIQEGDHVWPVGMEANLMNGGLGLVVGLNGYQVEGARQAGEFAIKPAIGNAEEKPVGEWNEAEIECIGKHMKVYINGVLQNEADGQFDRGFIALQSEGGPLQFRNITITEIR